MKKLQKTVKEKNKKKSFRGGEEYKALSLFILGTVGFLLLVYIGFGLVMVAIKADRLVHNQKIANKVPSEIGTVRRDIRNDDATGVNKERRNVNVIVKEVFGKITSINGDVVTVETKVYGDEVKNIRLKLASENEGGIFKYEETEDGSESEVEMKIEELEEGMYVGVRLPVEILLSEIEKDLVYVDNIVVDVEYEDELQE